MAIAVAAFALRLAIRLWLGAQDFWSEGYAFYPQLADSLLAGDGYRLPASGATAGRAPLYPLLLAALGGSGGAFWFIATVMAAISAGTVALTGLLARDRWGDRAGLSAAAVAALYPYFVVHDTALQESGLFACLAAAATLVLWRLDRPGARLRLAAIAGLLLGLAILTRPPLAPFALLAAAWAGWRRGAVHALLVLATAALAVSPWVAWTHRVTGQWTLSADTGRFLWLGNNADTFAAYPAQSIDRSQEIAFARLSPIEKATLFAPAEAVRHRRLTDRAIAYTAEHPAAVAAGAARKVGAAFGPLPSPRMSPLATAGYAVGYVPVLLLGLAGLWHGRRRWRHDALIYAHLATFVAVTAVFWAHTSHRAYLDVYLIVFAAGALAAMARRARA